MAASLKIIRILSALVIACAFYSCTYLDDDDMTDKPDTYQYAYGADDQARPFDYLTYQTITISVHVWDDRLQEGEGAFRPVSDGDFMPSGNPVRLGIVVDPVRTYNFEPMGYRILLSDGGTEFYVEAFPDAAGQYHVVDYVFDDSYVTYPLLITVLYSDMVAAKKKVMLTTHAGLRPEPGKLVEKGMAISLSKEILSGFTALDPSFLGLPEDGNMAITEFRPATTGNHSFHIGIGQNDKALIGIDLALDDTYTDEEGEEARGIGINLNMTSGDNLLFNLLFSIPRLMINAIGLGMHQIAAVDFSEQLSALAGSGGGESGASLGSPEVDTLLFLNLKGLPEQANADFAVIGGGLYAADKGEDTVDPEGNFVWPEVVIDESSHADTGIDMDLIKTDKTGFGIALSDYNINHMLNGLMRTFSIEATGGLAAQLTNSFPREDAGSVLSAFITANPAGIAMDMADPAYYPDKKIKLSVNDFRMQVRQDDIPITLVSMDLGLLLTPALRVADEKFFLDLVVEILPDLCHTAVIYDAVGFVMADKSDFALTLWGQMADANGQVVQSIPLSDMGILPSAASLADSTIELDGNGNCYMSLALDSFDPSKGGLCFISALDF